MLNRTAAVLAVVASVGVFVPEALAQRSGGGGGSVAGVGIEPIGTVRITTGLVRPVQVTHAPGDTSRIFIVEQRSGSTGRIRIFDFNTNTLLATPFLSISGVSTQSEQGLLGMAFHPNYANNGYFYVNFTNSAGTTVIRRYTVSANPNVANAASGFDIMTVSQPFTNHNAGWLAFGPDGYLYIAMGDGGSGNDPGNRAQNLGNILGKMLRIDVDGGSPYAIPASNPFVSVPSALNEIWAYGLRNPWRCAFDSLNGDLYIADVGQNAWEEINVQPGTSAGGENYGWRCKEGNNCTGLSGCTCSSPLLTNPVHVYGISGNPNCAVIGGEVYRGSAIPTLVGTYFFADYCSSQLWSFSYVGGSVTNLQNRTTELTPPAGQGTITNPTSYGLDANGEMYITTLGGSVYKIITLAEPAHPQDTCASALAVGSGITNFSNVGATTTGPDEPANCNFFGDSQIQNDVWFTHTVECTGNLTVDLCASSFPAKLGIYAVCPSGSGEVLYCNTAGCSTRAILTIPVVEGETYVLRIGGHTGITGSGVLNISCEPVKEPTCPADFNNSGAVDVLDLLILLGAWGPCVDCPEDLNNSGAVDVQDLLILLGAWGACE